jgi:hypothetical protein
MVLLLGSCDVSTLVLFSTSVVVPTYQTSIGNQINFHFCGVDEVLSYKVVVRHVKNSRDVDNHVVTQPKRNQRTVKKKRRMN